MKNLILVTIAFLSIFNSALFANRSFNLGTTTVKIESNASKKFFTVNLSNIGFDVITLEFRNSEGDVLITEKVKNTATYEKRFNLKKLPIGEYTLVFKNNTSESEQPIILKSKDIIVDEYARLTSYKPTISYQNGKIDLSLMNNLSKKVKIRLINELGEVSYFEVIKETLAISRRYDVSNLAKGDYSVVVNVGENIYSEQLTISK